MNTNRNVVGWFELYVQDMERAKAFYQKVLDRFCQQLLGQRRVLPTRHHPGHHEATVQVQHHVQAEKFPSAPSGKLGDVPSSTRRWVRQPAGAGPHDGSWGAPAVARPIRPSPAADAWCASSTGSAPHRAVWRRPAPGGWSTKRGSCSTSSTAWRSGALSRRGPVRLPQRLARLRPKVAIQRGARHAQRGAGVLHGDAGSRVESAHSWLLSRLGRGQ